ncbi:hypothetical protein A1O1_03590 [Capronia coronata CBS 617.96]|uniref:Carboxypeptidase n=1 Tax=Capronia coronata CBS 617.96 TaxID=1182541 RepID=W9YC87_9EURO|nr:uncharacterized protein A1O1_03590 [Capronia coronata CBS 617.96]EXJ90487.1 hypothetical protein A1O1_03590 [Capronia coronata CBS 617.96]
MKFFSTTLWPLAFQLFLGLEANAKPGFVGGVSRDSSQYTILTHDEYPTYSVRIREQHDDVCEAHSRQYTGWLDFEGKHMFFWYFDSQNDPVNDPLTLWLTGGPGVSSMIAGLFLELGPCRIKENGTGVDYHPYAWTKNTSMIFIDQPTGTGFSYADDGVELPSDSFMSAEDLYIFLYTFLTKVFPEKMEVPFHISGESYGGHYIPALSAEILKQNKIHPHRPQIPLQSVLIGNGFVSPMDTTFGYYETLCTTKPGVEAPVFNETRCTIIAETLPRCLYVHEACYKYPDEKLCKAADEICISIRDLYDQEAGAGSRDPYDITRKCEVEHLCYDGAVEVETYLNQPHILESLGIPDVLGNFSIESPQIVDNFKKGNDLYANTMEQVKYTLENGVDVLIYNGNLDLACNTAGNLRWTNALSWNGQAPFSAQDLKPWYTADEKGNKAQAGSFKEVLAYATPEASTKRRFAFVTVDKSGHMVPLQQPAVSLELYNRWIFGKPIDL